MKSLKLIGLAAATLFIVSPAFAEDLTSLSFVICPSVWPLDHGSVMAARTAALSLVIPVANDAIKLARASMIQRSNSASVRLRIMVWNLSMSMRAWRQPGG